MGAFLPRVGGRADASARGGLDDHHAVCVIACAASECGLEYVVYDVQRTRMWWWVALGQCGGVREPCAGVLT